MKKIKTAIIGVGKWGSKILRELDRQSEVIWACHQNSADSVKSLGEFPHVKTTTDLDQVLNDNEVQAVFVSVPTAAHFEIAHRALKAGKHVFVEKPGTDSYDKLEQLTLLAEEYHLKLAVGYVFVHHPAVKKLKEVIKPEEVREVHFSWLKAGSFNDHPVPNLVSHDLAVLRYLGFKKIDVLSYRSTQVISEDPDIVEVGLRSNDVKIKNYINRTSPITSKMLTITGPESWVWNNSTLSRIVLPGPQETDLFEQIGIEDGTPLGEEVRDFLEAVEKDRSPLVDGRFALDVRRLIDKIK